MTLARPLLAALAVAALAPPAAADPQSDLGRAVRQALVDAKAATWKESSDNAIKIVQTPVAAHWGKADFDADPRCNPYKRGPDEADPTDPLGRRRPTWVADDTCDPAFRLRVCGSGKPTCATGTTCTALAAAGDKQLCVGHSDALLDDLYAQVSAATAYVDIDSLYPVNGRYLASLRAALAVLAGKGTAIVVRVQYAGVTMRGTKEMLAELTDGLPTGGKLKIYLGTFLTGIASWNHAKIVAVDGKEAVVTGNNLVEEDYLNQQPVHDLGLDVKGTAARHAHDFADLLWGQLCDGVGAIGLWRGSYLVWNASSGAITAGDKSGCPRLASLPAASAGPGTAYVLSVPRLGAILADTDPLFSKSSTQPSDIAIAALIRNAKADVLISQPRMSEDKLGYGLIGASGGFATNVVKEIAQALARKVKVKVVFANVEPHVGDKDKGYGGMSPDDFIEIVGDWLPIDLTSQERHEALCRLRVSNLRFSAEDGYKAANHAKFVMADKQAYYVGSHNLYDANLYEYGYLVDDKTAATDMLSRYWGQLWKYSKAAAVSGCDVEDDD